MHIYDIYAHTGIIGIPSDRNLCTLSLFFFSSRRRHTRLQGDWSSDVCSSDLLRTFWVGALPVVEEKEGNNSFDTPQPIPLNVTVHGVVRAEQVDYYAVECKKGDRKSVV